ncbi:MAG: DUF2177 family protein [Bradyrhizobiaceae bacterium]|nr:MAG: DUF2177 family protein [Bradyrhizobiaceae bacterium]
MKYLIGYISILLVFGAIDAAWLSVAGRLLYRPTLGDILIDNVRLAPALVFYLIYPLGILAFSVIPAMRVDSIGTAFVSAVLFGAIAYATYDLTNFATLRNWTLQITVIDIAYGAVISGIAAMSAILALRLASRWLP